MRVIQVIKSINSEAGSVELLLGGLFGALREKGVESEVVHLNEGALSSGGTSGNGSLGNTIAFDRRGAAERFANADLVHLHGWGDRAVRQAAAAARDSGTPFVISPCGALSDDRFARSSWREWVRVWSRDKPLLRRAAAITAVNGEEQRNLDKCKLNSTLILLPYGLSFDDYADQVDRAACPDAKSNGLRLLMLGPIHPAEGCVPFLRALAEIGAASEGWKLVLAGPESREWRRMLEAAIRRKGGADRVTLASAPNLDAQRAWLAGATILADPSLRIHGPVSILQAIASGVPVLASTRVVPPGLEQVIRVCPPRREAFKQALLSMFELNAAQREAMAVEARELGRALFDWPVLAERYVEFYRRLI